MGNVDDPKPTGRDELPPLKLEARQSLVAGASQLSLLQIMIALIYFAVLFWALRHYFGSEQALAEVILGIIVGSGLGLVGLWIVWKQPRFAFLGWVLFVIGDVVMSGSTIHLRSSSLLADEGWFSPDRLRILLVKAILILPSLLILIGSILYLSARKRTNDQDALLGVLALSADRGMPLAPGVQAFSGQVSGIFQVWSETLGELLRRGVTLSEAVDSLPGLIPIGSRFLIGVGVDSGQLSLGLRESIASRSIQLPLLRKVGTQLAYVGSVLIASCFITGFLMYFIMPKFESIFKDFGIPLPETTIWVIKASHLAIDYALIPILAFGALGIAFVSSIARGGGMSIPLFDRLFARRHSLMILRATSLFIDANQPISSAMNSLSARYPTHWVRKKLAMVAADVERGNNWIESLHSTGLLGDSDVGVLASAQRAGNLSWALHELVQTGERRRSFRLQALTQLFFIGSMLLLGGIVLLLAIAYFSPLASLILRLSQ